MKKLSEFVTKNKMKIGVLLLCLMVLIVACIYYENNNKQIATITTPEEEKIKAQLDTAPEGYTEIRTAEELATVKDNLSGNYILMADIDMTDVAFEPIGTIYTTPFTGTFDGNYHKISNLKIESNKLGTGMFAHIKGGTISNLILENAKVTGGRSVGALVGYNEGKISNVGVTGEIKGTDQLGGLAGVNTGRGTITNAYSTVTVTGTSKYVGGLAGSNSGLLTNTYAVGKVTSTETSSVGGLTGNGGTATNSYWAVDTTGQTSGSGEGKFFSAMLKQETFTNWDFETVWQIEEGATLPYLRGMAKPDAVKAENYEYAVWEGVGTEETPYLIKTAKHLKEINNIALNVHYKLANDIDMQDEEFELIGPTQARAFTGTFDGNNHKISNLKIESTNEYVGMFGYINGGTVKNLGLENVNIKGTANSSRSGGLVGRNNGIIENSYVVGEVTGTTDVGGLVGQNTGIIENSYSIGDVTGISTVGGLVGHNVSATITNSYAIGDVTGTSNVGGLVGYNTGTIANAYAVVRVIGTTNVGGFVGYNYGSGAATSSYWAEDQSEQAISVIGEGKTLYEMLQKSSYQNWDFDTIWEMEEGHTLAHLKGMPKPEDIKIINLEGKGTEDVPYLIKTPEDLKQERYLANAYYQLANDIDASELADYKLANFNGTLDGNNHSINNLTMKSNSSYTGLFEQNKGTIKNLKLNNVNIESNYNGEMSYIGGVCAYNEGIIKNVEVNGVIKSIGNITNLYMGQITGYNKSLINKTHSGGSIINEGNVTNGYVGGITGYNDSIVRISYNTGTTSLKNIENLKVGGIAGKSWHISNAYSKGNINVDVTSATIGGIVGENEGIIRNTYSVENIGELDTAYNLGGIVGENIAIVESSYYNNPSIVEQDTKGTLKTIEELKQQDTFENWDFDNIWYMEENINMPVFQDIFKNDEDYYNENEYEADGYWEWHTRTTTNDQAYNGKHIVINPGRSIDFYGYGDTSYKDYLYKYYDYAGEKTFSFTVEEVRTDYHTLEGAGFIFNASKIDNKLSGYVLIIGQNDVRIYHLNNVDATTFETTDNRTLANYGTLIATGKKISSSTHKLIIKTSPTNVTVMDSGEEIINQNLDYTKHAGEDFGLIVSYTNHNCSSLSQIHFLGLDIAIKDYSVPVLKTDENGKRLSGAKFQVKNADGEVIREGITNTKGIYDIKGLQEGTYTTEEIESPAKHAFKNKTITFKVTSEGKVLDIETEEEIEIKIINEALKFEVKVVDTKGNPIQNSKVNLYDEEGNVVLGSNGEPIVVTTASDGTATITDIEAGTYTFKQTETPSDYILNDNIYTVTISKDGTVMFKEDANGTIVNKKYGHILFTKYKTGTTTPLKDAVIEIKDAAGNGGRLTTNAVGTIAFKAPPGTYTYKEVIAPTGYVLNATEHTFSVADDGTVTYDNTNGIIYNDRVTMKQPLIITKMKTETDIVLSGATIIVFDNEGNKVAEQVTGENGTVTFTGLEVGEYYYKEITAPAGYVLNNTEYHFTVENDGSVTLAEGTTKVIYNNRVTMGERDSFTVTKYRAGTEIALSGAVIGIFDADGNKISEQTTGESGIITISGLEVGSYYYKEITAPAGYVLNNTEYHFTVENDGTVTLADGVNRIIYNDRVTMGDKDTFTVTKYKTGTDKIVSGSVIGIFDAEGNKVSEQTTGESGTITISGLEVGNYYYKEITAPAGYVLNNTEYHFTVENDGTVTFAENTNKVIYNNRVTMSEKDTFTVTKYKTGTEKLVSGSVIGIFDADGNKISEQTTGESGIITISGLEVGEYYYKEIQAPAGYVLNNIEYHFTVGNDGSVTFAEGVNRIIYNNRVTMADKDNFTVTKYRTGTEIALSGAVIGIFDTEGNEVSRQTTGENGTITISDLEVGNYYYKEITAPAGYVLNNTEYHFTVENDGSVTFAENTNKVIYNNRVRMAEKDSFVVKKYKTGTDKIVSGSVIGIFDADGNKLSEQTTGENGTITISGLEVGEYYYKEITAPAGYVLNNTEYRFTVENDGSVTLAEGVNKVIYNNRVTMAEKDNFVITKYRTGTDIALSGAVIGIFDAEGNEVSRQTTGENGTITISGLEVGEYYYKEISAPAGYVLNDAEYHFTVTNDGTVTLAEGVNRIIYNDRVTMSEGLTITKYRTNTTIGLAGAVIGVFDLENNEVTRGTTNEAGQVTFTGLEVGNYYYKEISAPAGYVLNNTEYHFTVENDGTVTLAEGVNRIIYNDRVTMSEGLTITKYKTNTTIGLSGATIAVFDTEGNKVTEKVTGENGTVTFTGLEVGEYYYKEISAPAGYVLNNTEYHFTVNNDGTVTAGENTTFVIYNDREIVYGDVTIRKYITDTEVPLAGAVIGIFRQDGTPMTDKEGNPVQITTSAEGTIKFKITPGTYMYKEISAPTGYVLDSTEHTFTVSEEGIVTFDNTNGIIYNTKVTMTEGLTITKYKTGTKIPVAGAIIGLFDVNGKEVTRGTTNEAGQVTFTGLEIGSYYYKEISAPTGYILNNTEYHFTVENDGTVKAIGETNFVIYNDRVKAEHTIITKYITDTEIPVVGAVIGLFDADGNEIARQTTNEKGQVDFTMLEPGTYKYKEITAPDGYVLNDTMYTFTIADNGTVTFDNANAIIYNAKVTMKDALTITKYKTGTKIPVAGAIIGVFDEKGNEITRATTNEAGEVTFTGLEIGSYYYKEITAPTGYILNNTEYHFTVNNDGTVTLAEGATKVIYNDRVSKDHIIITKYVTDTTSPVPGAVIGLFDVNGNKLTEKTTDEKGQVDFAGLEAGTYKYKELTAPGGYVLNDTMYTFTIAEDGTVTFDSSNGIIYNSKVTMKDSLIIVKYRTNTKTPVAGAVIGVFDEKGKEIARQTTDENGTVIFTGIQVGNYYYKEISAPTGYVLNSTEYHFTVENDGTVTLAENATKVIYNDRLTVDHVIITKYEEGTKVAVAGAVIGLFDANGNEITRGATNEKGQVDFTTLEPGTYKYRELTAPDGYVLNDTMYTFTIAEDGTVIFDTANGIIYNKKEEEKPDIPKVYGDVTLVKYEEGTTIRVEGAIIGIYDKDGNPIKNEKGNVIQFITNEYGEAKFKILPGTYQYKELKAPDGYILNETTYTFTVAEDGTVTFKENTNGIIYNKKKQDKPEVPEVYGNITIVKYEEGTKTGLKGAIIGIYDINKKEVKITTGDNGTVSFKAKPGVYQYQELVAPDGYELNNTIYTFTVTKTGEVIFDNNTNGIIYDKKKEEKPAEPDKPDTPDIPDIPDKPDVPDKPEEPNKPVTPDTPKGNTIIPGQNTIIKEQPENMVNGRLPQTGETEGMVIITLILAVFGIYFGIKIRNKQ